MTFRELVYLVLDEVKQLSDDAYFTEDHIVFLLSKYRSFLLKQRYSDIKKMIPEINYQTISMDMTTVPAMPGDSDPLDFQYLKSNKIIPIPLQAGFPRVYGDDYLIGEITYISRDRMRYVGFNKFMNNIAYASILPDQYMYIKTSNNAIIKDYTTLNFTAIFLDAVAAAQFSSDTEILDKVFPLEDSLVAPIVELCLKELLPAVFRPQDRYNNSKDDEGDLAQFVRQNTKSNMQKQLE